MGRRRFGRARLVLTPLLRRRSRALLSLLALALGACLVTALTSLYSGVQANLGGQFRRYGANLIATPAPGETLMDAAGSARGLSALPDSVGLLYDVAEADGQAVVVGGADLARLRGLNPSWRVSGTPPQAGEAWLGVNAARLLHKQMGDTVTLRVDGRSASWRVAGTITAGTSEDNQILAPWAQVAVLTGEDGFTTLQFRIAAGAAGIGPAMAAAQARLAQWLPGARLRPVRQITSGEARILLSTRGMLLAASLLILFTVGLCVTAALTTLALERRRDFALMKALGGSEWAVVSTFVGEAALLGAAAALLGMVAGAMLAGGIGVALFGVWIWPTAAGLGAALGLTVLLAALAAALPWPIIHATSPAALLRGE